ncbi:adenylyl-sulfate kinase [Pseudomonas kunmingensis]|uniref:adenylyl-sulfate kinase n=1 Tax=Stutzerimonas kunmingensis TaxID=1211807 RepID=UPI0017466759|nr:adenylyl-sulfate kinase [Stutzerimonas kunmingensis]MBD3873689.1 adenylyl-sulfate kinase [Stutzerimonas kunmingensis]
MTLFSPHTWWLTGLPSAGKTTLANALVVRLRADAIPACVIDGDEIRQGLCRDLGFSAADRAENMRRVAELARLINQSGIHAVIALVSPTRQGRARAREIIGGDRFIEVHVATPLAVCEERDPKGLYRRARNGELADLTGISAAYEAPAAPDIRIDTSRCDVAKAIDQLLNRAIK